MRFDSDPRFETTYAHSPGVREVVQEVVWDVHDVFQATAPRDTGAMVASAYPIISRTPAGWQGAYEVPVENERGTKYAKFVEFGTKHMAAQHHLRNALETIQASNT